MKYLTRSVWILSIISLFNDAASEMLYPVMPIYLKSIGFSVVIIGILEGLAELISGLSKGYFGNKSDIIGKRVPFVQAGYALSALAKPLIVVIQYPLWIFFTRTMDRFGKGIRNGARDALLSDESTPQTKGRVFGFHRSMDTFGAVIGPLLALLYLSYHPGNYTTLFYLTIIPGVLTIIATFLIKESKKDPVTLPKSKTSIWVSVQYFRSSPLNFKKLVGALWLFALFNSSDMFLILGAKSVGFSDSKVIGFYIFYNLVYAVFAFPLGILADKIGLKRVLIFGLILFSSVYAGLSLTNSSIWYWVLFLLYGVYAAATEGVSKAWITNSVTPDETATAIGTFTGIQSILTFLASSLTGIIWYLFGLEAAFLTTASITVFVVIFLSIFVPGNQKPALVK